MIQHLSEIKLVEIQLALQTARIASTMQKSLAAV
jgi:hypothetical protein